MFEIGTPDPRTKTSVEAGHSCPSGFGFRLLFVRLDEDNPKTRRARVPILQADQDQTLIPPQVLVNLTVYAFAYSVALLALGALAFRRRDLK